MKLLKLSKKVSAAPLWILLSSAVCAFLYFLTCGACSYTGNVTWWQIGLIDASIFLFYMGALGLSISLMTTVYALVRGKDD